MFGLLGEVCGKTNRESSSGLRFMIVKWASNETMGQ